MGNAPKEEKSAMKCTMQGCPGEYEARTVVHTVKRRGEVIVIDHVPAEVCGVCGDVLLAPETVRRIEATHRLSTLDRISSIKY